MGVRPRDRVRLRGRIPPFVRRVGLSLGGGYRLWKEEVREARSVGTRAGAEPPGKTGDEVMPFAGQTVVNSLKDP